MYDVVLIGLGASGLMFSNIIDKSLKVLILEKNEKAGKKLLITGNGRCNLTNNKDNKSFLENVDHNKKYLYSSIYKFGPKEIMDFFKIKLKEEKENQIFPVSDNANEVLNFLLKKSYNNIRYNTKVDAIIKKDDYYKVLTNDDNFKTKKVVIATGGASFKILGSSSDHMKFAKMLNQDTIPLYPAETSIIINESNDLAGTSFDRVDISFNKKKFVGNLIYTHNGLSGNSIMKASEYIFLEKVKNIKVDFLNNISKNELEKDITKNKDIALYTYLKKYFTKKFVSYILDKFGISQHTNIKSVNKKSLEKVIDFIKEGNISVKKVTDIDKAYVTGGGIDLRKIDTKTFESKTNKGLYFIGEALDLHGPIGGYNLTIAFSTAYSAAISINERLD